MISVENVYCGFQFVQLELDLQLSVFHHVSLKIKFLFLTERVFGKFCSFYVREGHGVYDCHLSDKNHSLLLSQILYKEPRKY